VGKVLEFKKKKQEVPLSVSIDGKLRGLPLKKVDINQVEAWQRIVASLEKINKIMAELAEEKRKRDVDS
jgi:hypothetical protein